MSNYGSKVRENCMKAIMEEPGIPRTELYTKKIGHKSYVRLMVLGLIYERRVVQAWDEDTKLYRLYPKGKEPRIHNEHKGYKKSLFSMGKSLYFKEDKLIPKGVHGEAFRMAFDEAFGLLYIDLKILGMAAQDMKNGIS